MKRLIAACLAASIATPALAIPPGPPPGNPALCLTLPFLPFCPPIIVGPPPPPPPPPASDPAPTPARHGSSGASTPWPVFCVFGSAGALITAAAYVGHKFNRELTIREAQIIGFTCGIGAFYVVPTAR